MEVSPDRLERAVQGLRSPASLVAFVAFWIVLAVAAPTLSPLLVILVAALLGSAAGTAAEAGLRLYASPRRLRAVSARVFFMWEQSLQLPPSAARPIRVGLHALACELYAGAITADHAEQRADGLMGELTREQARFLGALEEGQVRASVLEAIRDDAKLALDPRTAWRTEKELLALGRKGSTS